MRKHILLTMLCFSILSSFLFWACQKELSSPLTSQQNNSRVLALIDPMNTERVRLINHNMLEFDDYRAFLGIKKELNNLSNDLEYRREASIELGYDVDNEDAEVATHPVLEKFEKRFEFTTLRASEANRFKEFLNAGNDPDDFPEHFLWDDTFKSFLNTDGEVKIGDFIFKYFDMRHVVMVSNADWKTFERVKNTNVRDLKDGRNVFVWDNLNLEDLQVDIFERDGEGNPIAIRGACKLNFTFLGTPTPNLVNFTNTSTVTCPNVEYVWDFGDGSPLFYGFEPPPHTFPAIGYPFTVKLVTKEQCSCLTVNESVVKKSVGNPCNINSDFLVTFKPGSGNIVTFAAVEDYPTPEYQFTWVITDANGAETTFTTNSVDYTFNGWDNCTYSATLTITQAGCTQSSTTTKPVIIDCGWWNAKDTERTKVKEANGRSHRMSGAIWVHNYWVDVSTGCSSQMYKRKLGVWVAANASTITTNDNGKIIFLTPGGPTNPPSPNSGVSGAGECNEVDVDNATPSSLSDDSYVKKDLVFGTNTGRVRFFDEHFFSNHFAKVGGVDFTIDKLLLIK